MYDTRAIEYAKKYKFPFSAGSDIHSTNLFGGGVAFKKRLNHIQEFIEIMKSDGDYVLTNGMYWYTKQGDIIE